MSVPDRDTALERLSDELAAPIALLGAGPWSSARLAVLLARAEVRAWRVATVERDQVISGICPTGGGWAIVAWSRTPRPGPPEPDGWIVGRALPVAAGRWVLIGRPTVVGAEDAARSLTPLIRQLRAPRGEFWGVHGGVVARSARALAAGARVPSVGRAMLGT